MRLKYYTHLFPGLKVLLMAAAMTTPGIVFAQLPNDDCGGAINVTPGTLNVPCSPISGTTVEATNSSPAPTCNGAAARDIWYSFVADGANYTASLNVTSITNPAGDYLYGFGMAAYSGNCGALTTLACATRSAGTASGGSTPNTGVSLNGLTAGQTYFIRIWTQEAYNASSTQVINDINFNLCITNAGEPPANDICANAAPIFGTAPVNGNTSAALNDVTTGYATCGNISNNTRAKGLWYKLTPATTGSLTIATCGSSFDTYLRVYTGGSCAAFAVCPTFNDDGCSLQSTTTFNAAANAIYYILVTGKNAASFGAFTLSVTGVPLKVEMGMLSGKVTGSYAQLNWMTYNEHNNRGFEIQRSADGKLFEYAGFVNSKGANGNSKEAQTYDFTDPVTVTGRVFYRLKQTDIDQSVTYSNVIGLGNDNGPFSLTATPNPATSKLNLKIRGRGERTGQLLVTDLSGKVCHSTTIHNDNTEIDLSTLACGIYLLKYADALYTQTLKIQKQ